MESSSATSGGSTRREVTRQKLYEAAVTLIAEQGFSATTVDEIAERAGVAKGTVYYNFASKAALLSALLEFGVDRLARALAAAADRDPDGALAAVVRAELEFVREREAFARLLLAETWRTDEGVLVRERAVAVLAGVLDETADAATAAAAVFGMVLTAALDRRARPLDEVHTALMALLLGYLNAGAVSASSPVSSAATHR
jgi:AcrR family transcriptional regulator